MADPYPTAAELVAASDIDALGGLSADQQESLRLASISAVEEFVGQSFDSAVGTEVLDGQGANYIYLPRRLTRLDSLVMRDASFPVVDWQISNDGSRLSLKPIAGLGYYEQALMEVSGQHLPAGIGNISVTGLWGWDAVPETIKLALRLDMEDQALADANGLALTVRGVSKLGLRGVSQGNLSLQIGSGGSRTGPAVPGAHLSARVLMLLRPYIWQGQIGALA